MKKNFLSWSLLAMMAVVFVSCDKDDEKKDTPPTLIGKWVMVTVENHETKDGVIITGSEEKKEFKLADEVTSITFKEDGKITILNKNDKGGNDKAEGEWSYNENDKKLTIITQDEDDDKPYTDIYTVKELTLTKLVLEDKGSEIEATDGSKYGHYSKVTFTKVQ